MAREGGRERGRCGARERRGQEIVCLVIVDGRKEREDEEVDAGA